MGSLTVSVLDILTGEASVEDSSMGSLTVSVLGVFALGSGWGCGWTSGLTSECAMALSIPAVALIAAPSSPPPAPRRATAFTAFTLGSLTSVDPLPPMSGSSSMGVQLAPPGVRSFGDELGDEHANPSDSRELRSGPGFTMTLSYCRRCEKLVRRNSSEAKSLREMRRAQGMSSFEHPGGGKVTFLAASSW